MSYYEYVVIPVSKAAPRAKGMKRTDERFAHGLSETLNQFGAEGWQFQRTETMSVEAKAGFFSRPASEQVTVMIFRRRVGAAVPDTVHLPRVAAERHEPRRGAAPAPVTPAGAQAAPEVQTAPALTASRRPEGNPHPLQHPNRPSGA